MAGLRLSRANRTKPGFWMVAPNILAVAALNVNTARNRDRSAHQVQQLVPQSLLLVEGLGPLFSNSPFLKFRLKIDIKPRANWLRRHQFEAGLMFFFSLGLPGKLAAWCDAAIQSLVEQNGYRISRLDLAPPDGTSQNNGGLDQAVINFVGSGAGHFVISSHGTDLSISTLLSKTGAPFILALDDPRKSTAALYTTFAVDLHRAARVIANLCPDIMEQMTLPGALIVRAHDLSDGGEKALRRIAAHLDIPVPSNPITVASSVSQLLPECADPELAVPEPSRRSVSGLLRGYADYFETGTFGNLIWKREFMVAARDGSTPTKPIKLRDVANGLCLLYGPYIRLPPGYWSAKVMVGVSKDASGQTLVVEAFAGRVLAATKFIPHAEGIYTVNTNFSIDARADPAVEIRIMVSRNSAPGEITFGEVELHPVTLATVEAVEQSSKNYLDILHDE